MPEVALVAGRRDGLCETLRRAGLRPVLFKGDRLAQAAAAAEADLVVVELGEATSGIDIDQACELMQEAPQTRLLLVARRLSEKSFKRVLQELPHVPVVSSDAADKIVRSAVDSTLQAPRSG